MRAPTRCDDKNETMGVRDTGRSCGVSVQPTRSRIHLPTIATEKPSAGAGEQGRTVGSSGASGAAWAQVHGPSGFIGQ
jgi:hypothetical protein